MSQLLGTSVAIGISGLGSTVQVQPRQHYARDELLARWRKQFMRRPFNLRVASGRFAGYSILMPPNWTPSQGTMFPLGDIRHVVMARRFNKGAGSMTHGGQRQPFWVPLLQLYAHVDSDGPQAIAIGGAAGLQAQYDLAHQPYRSYGGGLVLPRSHTQLLQTALDMEERLVEAALGRPGVSWSPPVLPRFYAVFSRRLNETTRVGAETVEETRAATDLVLETLAGGGVLTDNLSSPGGVVSSIEAEENWIVVTFMVAGDNAPQLVHRFLPSMAVLEPYVQVGTSIEQGTRIAYYATPRNYPTWKVAKEVLGEFALDILADVVKALDFAYDGYVYRNAQFCPCAVREQRCVAIYEDVSALLEDNGLPLIQVAPYNCVFSEFVQGGTVFRANVWSANVRTVTR